MFVPRALRLKGVTEPKKSGKEPPAKRRRIEGPASNSGRVDAAPGEREKVEHPSARPVETRFTTPAITPAYLGQLVCGIELLFTDYAHQDKHRAAWLQKHYRDVQGEPNFIHLSAILEHPNMSSLKPEPTQPVLQRALREHPSPYIESSGDGYFVRRRPSTYPLSFIPKNSFEVVDDNGLTYWDQRTIYVEPHIRDLCRTPAKVAHWLKEHGEMREKWLPIQAVHFLYNSCAFVTLSGNVTHEGTWKKWRSLEKPEYWKIMTKVEHTKRTNEYLELRRKEKGGVDNMMEERSTEAKNNPGGNRAEHRKKEKEEVNRTVDEQSTDAAKKPGGNRAERRKQKAIDWSKAQHATNDAASGKPSASIHSTTATDNAETGPRGPGPLAQAENNEPSGPKMHMRFTD